MLSSIMGKSCKIVVLATLLFWVISNALASSIRNDAATKSILQRSIREKCLKEFSFLSSTSHTASEKSRTFSTITLTKVTSENTSALLKRGFIHETPETKFLRLPLFPFHSGLGLPLTLIECLSPFPVRLQMEFLTEKGETRSVESVKSGLERRVVSTQHFFVDSLLFKLDTNASPPFLNATCVMEETPHSTVLFSSRFTFSLKRVANGKPGKSDIREDNLSRGYYAETVSTPTVLQLCAPMLPWNDGDPEEWLYDYVLSSTPKDDLPEEDEEGNAFFWLHETGMLYFLILVICVDLLLIWVKSRETTRENP